MDCALRSSETTQRHTSSRPAQLYWAWLKNRDLAVTIGGQPERICWKFRQEYPATASEAFQMSGDESFIPVDRVAKARKGQVSGYGAMILGVDPARGGKDKTGIDRSAGKTAWCQRQGADQL